jgi:hypothetical protein
MLDRQSRPLAVPSATGAEEQALRVPAAAAVVVGMPGGEEGTELMPRQKSSLPLQPTLRSASSSRRAQAPEQQGVRPHGTAPPLAEGFCAAVTAAQQRQQPPRPPSQQQQGQMTAEELQHKLRVEQQAREVRQGVAVVARKP